MSIRSPRPDQELRGLEPLPKLPRRASQPLQRIWEPQDHWVRTGEVLLVIGGVQGSQSDAQFGPIRADHGALHWEIEA